MITNLKTPVPTTSDLRTLSAFLQALAGQTCVKVAFSYGDELRLHFGAATVYEHPRLRNELKGTWIISTRASWWRLFLAGPGLVIQSGQDDTPEEREANKKAIAQANLSVSGLTVLGSGVTQAVLDPFAVVGGQRQSGVGLSLVLLFADGSNFVVCPSPDDSEDEPLADWEILTPYNTIVVCGPGPTWEARAVK